jgi:hypothetical protein
VRIFGKSLHPSTLAVSASLSLAAFASVAHGQADLQRFNRQLEQIQRDTRLQANQDLSLDERVFIDYGGYATFGYLSVDDNVNQQHVLRQYEGIAYARINFDNAHEFFLRARGGWRDFNDGDSFDGRGDERIDPELDRWYYRFDLQRHQAAYYGKQIDYNLIITGGRDLYIWGNGLVLSQDVQGIDVLFDWGGNELEVLAGITPTRSVDFDASRPNFDTNTKRGFYGAQLSRQIGQHRPFIYGLIQQDYNTDDTLTTGPVVTDFDYNSWYLAIGSTGAMGDRILYGVEAVYEGGTNLSNSFTSGGGPFITPIPQTEDDIRAWALDARLDYLTADERHRTRFSGEAILASGDDDRGNTSNTFGGNAPNTADRAFNAFGLLNTGLAFAPQVSNMLAFRVGASTFPLPDMGPLRRLQIGTDIFIYNKLDTDAPIDEPSADERYLGWEPDFYLNWQATSDVTFVLRYGVFFPNPDAFAGDDTARQYIYAGVTYAF